jgi:hypothetical protein
MGTIRSESRRAKTAPENGFAIARDNLAFFKRALAAPDFFDHTNLRVWDINDPEQSRQANEQNDQPDCAGNRVPGRHGEMNKE